MKSKYPNIKKNSDIEQEIIDCLHNDSYVQHIASSIDAHIELTPLEKDFAYRFATEPVRTNIEWATFYRVHTNKIALMKKNPELLKLVEDIKYNIRMYTASKQVVLYKIALDQYDKIFSIPENDTNLETKRKAAHDIIEFWHTGASGGKFSMENDQTDLENEKKNKTEITDLMSAKQRLLEIQQLKAQTIKSDVNFSNNSNPVYEEKIIDIKIEQEEKAND